MDLTVLNTWLIAINSKTWGHQLVDLISLFSYLLLLLVLLADKKFTSSALGMLILCLGQSMGTVLTPNLIEIASTEALLNYFAWYGSWILLYITCLALLLKFHRFYQLRLSDVSFTLVWYYVALSLIQVVDFIDRATFDTNFFAVFYQLGGLLLGTFIAPVVGLLFLREYYQRRQLQLQEC